MKCVKSLNHFDQNRPVHLARRDVYFERVVELMTASQPGMSHRQIDASVYEEILFLLRVARQHGFFAIRNEGEHGQDAQFARFINLLAGNVKAILSMLNLKEMVESTEKSISTFLSNNYASVALQAEEYERRANDIVRSIHNTLRLAEEPFAQLKVDNAAAVSEEELNRYNKAREHFRTRIREGRHRHETAPNPHKTRHF